MNVFEIHLLLVQAEDIRHNIDWQAGDAFRRCVLGDASAFAVLHERLNVLGFFELADDLAAFVEEHS